MPDTTTNTSGTVPGETLLSILVPMYNESEVIPVFFERIEKLLLSTGMPYEIVCVDDGSRDTTLDLLRAHAARNPCIKVLAFSRNFGKEAALTAALDHASGAAVIPMDTDLQDPPELIPEMLKKWQQGFDVVFAKRSSRASDSYIKHKTAVWFYKLFNQLSDTSIPDNVGDFRLMDRKVVEVIRRLPEKDRFMKGLFCWPGFTNTTVEYERPVRAEGQTKFSMWRLLNLALSGIVSFSTMPIRAGIYLGLLISLVSFLFALYIIAKTLIFGVDVPGYASIMVTVLFLSGIQLFFMGLMGEYIGRIYKEVKNRPLYVVSETIGFTNQLQGKCRTADKS